MNLKNFIAEKHSKENTEKVVTLIGNKCVNNT
jgi:hypothetical protein